MKISDMVTGEVNGKKCVARVRKLTEREYGRLMGVDDDSMTTSVGNSIVADVLYHIFRKAFIPSQRTVCDYDIFNMGGTINGSFKDKPLRVATLCSGYDSQFMALDRLARDFPDEFAYQRVWFSEHDPESNKPDDKQPADIAHKALYPDCPNLGDMTKIDWAAAKETYGDVDLLFYSTPCQSISQAGLQHGFTEGGGTRSSIIWNVRDALRILQPRFACLENVAAMVTDKFKPMFNLWCDTVKGLGYANFAELLNAKHYGVPQNRERIFMFSVHEKKNSGTVWYELPKRIPRCASVELRA